MEELMNAAMAMGLLIVVTLGTAQPQVSSLPASPFGYVMSQQSSTMHRPLSAAQRDVLETIRREFGCGLIILRPVVVQARYQVQKANAASATGQPTEGWFYATTGDFRPD
jgi:hypothetical protein